MELVAVALDHQPQIGPEVVDLEWPVGEADDLVDKRLAHPRRAADRPEPPLELAPEARPGAGHRGEGVAQPARPTVPGVALEDFGEGAEVELAECLGLLEGGANVGRPRRREVEQGPGDRGAGDAVSDDPVGSRQGGKGVRTDAPPPRLARRHHVDQRARVRGQLEVGAGRAEGQQRPGPTGEHGGDPVPGRGERRGPERVDALVDAVEAADPCQLAHAINREPEVGQLRKGDNPVLAASHARQGSPVEPLLARLQKSNATLGFCRFAGHRRIVPGKTARVLPSAQSA